MSISPFSALDTGGKPTPPPKGFHRLGGSFISSKYGMSGFMLVSGLGCDRIQTYHRQGHRLWSDNVNHNVLQGDWKPKSVIGTIRGD